MTPDSLKELLNHTTREQLVQEALRAERSKSYLAFQMLSNLLSMNPPEGGTCGQQALGKSG
ncbi:hypothetical protein ACVWVQ_000011 [Thermostichus sp. MS-CIW-36]|jgi:hypothetical protein